MSSNEIPDIAGRDVSLTAQPLGRDLSPDPVAEANKLAAAIEEENAQGVIHATNLGADPLELQIGIVKTGLGEVINFIPMAPLLRAQFEVAVEAAIAKYLDDVSADLARQRSLGVGVPSGNDVSRLEK